MTSPVDVANIALDNIGARFSITSLNPPLPPPNAAVVARQYQPRIDALMRAAHWDFARKEIGLTLLAAAAGTPENQNGSVLPVPPFPWQYEYAYPNDCLKARFLIPNPPQVGTASPPVFAQGTIATPIWPWTNPGYIFKIATDVDNKGNAIKVILTDVEFAQLVYTSRVTNCDLWDPLFLNAAASYLGSWLVNPLARNAEVLKEQIAITKEIVEAARISDGNEGMTSIDRTPDWMAVRGATGYATLGDASFYFGWDWLSFPGGILV